MTTPWTWTGIADDTAARVHVGRGVMYIERVDGAEMTDAVHRAALVEALGAAVAEVRGLRAAAQAVERKRTVAT